MKPIIAALLLACAPLTAQAAENFTFNSTAKGIDGVRAPATGPQFMGGRVFSISTETVYADGHKETTAGKCAAWTNPPGSQFTQTGVCEVANIYTLRYNCGASDKPNEANCWGLLTGAGGRFLGRTGVIAYRASTGSIGVGTWN